MSERTTNDPRTDALKIEMAERWANHEEEYRDMENFEGSEIVYEDSQLVIVADLSQQELNRCLDGHDIPYQVVKGWMRDVAEEKTEYDWSDADPLVFDKLEEAQ